jgi:hypothetical protein
MVADVVVDGLAVVVDDGLDVVDDDELLVVLVVGSSPPPLHPARASAPTTAIAEIERAVHVLIDTPPRVPTLRR